MAVTPGKDIAIVDDEVGWLPALEALNEQAHLCSERASAGLELVQSHYHWPILDERLYENHRSWLVVD